MQNIVVTYSALLGLWVTRQVTFQSDPRVGVNDSQFEPRTIQLILSILIVLCLINNMYVNPQLANYIHTRSLSASIC